MPDHVQQLQMSDNQIQLQLLQKLQQQKQTLLAQQTALQQPTQLTQIQDQQRQLLDKTHNLSRALTPGQVLEIPHIIQNSLPEANSISNQMTKANCQSNIQFSQQPKLQQQQQPGMVSEMPGHMALLPTATTNQLSAGGSSIVTGAGGAGQSVITDDVPSRSTSPSTNNCTNALPQLINSRFPRSTMVGDDMAHSAATILSSSALETSSSNANMLKDLQPKFEVKPSLNISKIQNQGHFAPHTYLNGNAAHTDCLDTSSSTTQIGMPLNPDSLLTKGTLRLGKYLSNNFSSEGMLGNYENNRDAQQELSSSMVSQTFGVPDMAFNSIDSTIDDSNFLNSGPWAPPPAPPPLPPAQFQRMRTYTKVYKRGAVGRSIDITRYSGYEELKKDLARRFGIEGQLEDRQRIGWKLVYVDHESDVLLVGDDPWEEFVNCVRCIKILSPQEVQQMSLDGDFGNGGLQNQACSSSDGNYYATADFCVHHQDLKGEVLSMFRTCKFEEPNEGGEVSCCSGLTLSGHQQGIGREDWSCDIGHRLAMKVLQGQDGGDQGKENEKICYGSRQGGAYGMSPTRFYSPHGARIRSCAHDE
ncbi:hypothetical protein JHK82_043388 [Glycine max]|nr:hypothetical protein JHK82_043388 [Glycine max]